MRRFRFVWRVLYRAKNQRAGWQTPRVEKLGGRGQWYRVAALISPDSESGNLGASWGRPSSRKWYSCFSNMLGRRRVGKKKSRQRVLQLKGIQGLEEVGVE